MKVRVLEKRHEDYDPDCWKSYGLLYQGGREIWKHVKEVLIQNSAEHKNWFEERKKRFTYKNIAGTIVDDYGSTVLQEPIDLRLKKPEDGDRPKPDKFYTDELFVDPTHEGLGENLNDLAFRVLTGAMVKKRAWVMVTMPAQVPGYQNLAEQEAAGQNRAMFRWLAPENIVNWIYDAEGLASVMTRFEIADENLLADDQKTRPQKTIQWTLYTRKTTQQWAITLDADRQPTKDVEVPEVQAETEHILSGAQGGRGAVPVRCFVLKDALWILDRIGLLCLNETRKRNALSWYEFLTCFPQLIHRSDEPMRKGGDSEDGGTETKRGAQYVYDIAKDADLAWLEPSGTSLTHLSARLDSLERDIYKSMQQMAAAQGPGAAAATQSGFSKVRDNLAKTILCERYADRLRPFFTMLATLASEARGDLLEWECVGASRFDSQDSDAAVTTAIKANALPWLGNTPTGTKEIWKRTLFAMLPDLPTQTRDIIEAELEAAKVSPPATPEEILASHTAGGGPPGKTSPPSPGGRDPKSKASAPKPGQRVGAKT